VRIADSHPVEPSRRIRPARLETEQIGNLLYSILNLRDFRIWVLTNPYLHCIFML
jgi:hypothetical protein